MTRRHNINMYSWAKLQSSPGPWNYEHDITNGAERSWLHAIEKLGVRSQQRSIYAAVGSISKMGLMAVCYRIA
eukprot:6201153-Pleurochrysis_carterae.AAC.1